MPDPKMTHQEEIREREAVIVLYIFGAAIAAAVLWIAHTRLFLTDQQLVELSLWPILTVSFAISAIRYFATREQRRAELWPKTSPVITSEQDKQHLAEAVKKDAVLVGHRTTGEPFFWSQEQRSMQGICFGQSGSGKSTLEEGIIQQDIARGAPIIFMDGKGEQKLLQQLIPAIAAAGRMHHLRLIDPQHPGLSASYNPLWIPEGLTPEDQVAFIFDSFKMNSNAFFDDHQRVYLENLVRILHYSGHRFNFHDVLVIAYDVSALKRQVQAAMEFTKTNPVSPEERQALAMSVQNLATSFEDKERVSKIQGLINHLSTFMTRGLAQITGGTDQVLNMNQVIDENLILYLCLNVNVNGKAVASLGRILLQNLQLMIGLRYSQSGYDTQHKFVSVIMDEFAPFAYEEFAQIINQARGTNVGFLFSLQSAPQLLKVGESFESDLSSAPNTTFMLRAKNDATAAMFLKQTSLVKDLRRSVQVVRKGLFSATYEEQDEGTQTEVTETAAKDMHLKRMPKGQMEALVSDDRQGSILEHVHVRKAALDFLIVSTEAVFFPPRKVCQKHSEGLHLDLPGVSFQQPDTRNARRNSSRGGLR
jgi:type IV secretory pathway TraG/TraD family ATPase VirD4